jgi:hypothetical protein
MLFGDKSRRLVEVLLRVPWIAMSGSEVDGETRCSVDGEANASNAVARVAIVRSESYNELACTLQHLGTC